MMALLLKKIFSLCVRCWTWIIILLRNKNTKVLRSNIFISSYIKCHCSYWRTTYPSSFPSSCVLHNSFIVFSLYSILLKIPWNYVDFLFRLITLKLSFWRGILKILAIAMLCFYHDTQVIIIFAMTLLDSGFYGMRIRMLKIMFLFMVIGYYWSKT